MNIVYVISSIFFGEDVIACILSLLIHEFLFLLRSPQLQRENVKVKTEGGWMPRRARPKAATPPIFKASV